MICEQCRKNEANVFLTQIIDGEMANRQLCESCAQTAFGNLPYHRRFQFAPPSPSPTPTPENVEDLANLPTEVSIPDPITVRDLCAQLRIRPFHVISLLMTHDIFASMKTAIDFATASRVCAHYKVKATKMPPSRDC